VSEMRGQRAGAPSKPESIGLPPRPFLYTIDQIAAILDVRQTQVENHYVHFEGRSIGAAHRGLLVARNIAPPGAPPDWRVAEREIIRWFKHKGFRWYERGYPTH
jgi:hypothetical protein